MKYLEKLAEIAGNLGFLVGGADRRREQSRKEKRTWGVAVEGVVLSATPNTAQPSADDPLRIEVALLNSSTELKTFSVGAWLDFFPLAIVTPNGSEAALTSYGKRQFEAVSSQAQRDITVKPEQVIDADIPVGILYDLRQPGVYRITGRCVQSSAVSNEIQIRI